MIDWTYDLIRLHLTRSMMMLDSYVSFEVSPPRMVILYGSSTAAIGSLPMGMTQHSLQEL